MNRDELRAWALAQPYDHEAEEMQAAVRELLADYDAAEKSLAFARKRAMEKGRELEEMKAASPESVCRAINAEQGAILHGEALPLMEYDPETGTARIVECARCAEKDARIAELEANIIALISAGNRLRHHAVNIRGILADDSQCPIVNSIHNWDVAIPEASEGESNATENHS